MPLRQQLLKDGQYGQVEQFPLGDGVAKHIRSGLHVRRRGFAQVLGQCCHTATATACGHGVVTFLFACPLRDSAVDGGHLAFI